jgi:hypothetical protein
LKPGDLLPGHDGRWVSVEEVVDTGEWETVYNLQVADHHTYFVGSEEWGFSVWAHNAEGCGQTPDERALAEYGNEIALAREYQHRAAEYAENLPRDYSGSCVAVSGFERTVSAWSKPPGGYDQATTADVRALCEEIGHELGINLRKDQGVDGEYYASHAEKQMALVNPDAPIGVNKDYVCGDCKTFFQALAISRGHTQIIADSQRTHVFFSDGTHAEIFP